MHGRARCGPLPGKPGGRKIAATVPAQTRILASIDQLEAGQWNALAGPDNPFVQHEYLSSLESSACLGPGTGWQPQHLVLQEEGRILGALPLYLKSDSWGEFVFDQSWAHAYEQAGLPYYPKLVSAVPFTPVTGPRLLAPAHSPGIQLQLLAAARDLAEQMRLSSVHVLFPDKESLEALKREGWLCRKDCQFHWFNHDYHSFEHFLEGFSSKRRKTTRRERRKIAEAGIFFRQLSGDRISEREWDFLYRCYASTFLRRGRHPYMTPDFFRSVGAKMGSRLLAIQAEQSGNPLAAAIFFIGTDTLYGRYWGSMAQVDSLHFETCYYQGIKYCIEHGLKRFDPGTQGEHKIARGFDPVFTWSAHWIVHPGFRRVIEQYLERESLHVENYREAARELLPFRQQPGAGEQS
jgi:predicted N-acyltransferase